MSNVRKTRMISEMTDKMSFGDLTEKQRGALDRWVKREGQEATLTSYREMFFAYMAAKQRSLFLNQRLIQEYLNEPLSDWHMKNKTFEERCEMWDKRLKVFTFVTSALKHVEEGAGLNNWERALNFQKGSFPEWKGVVVCGETPKQEKAPEPEAPKERDTETETVVDVPDTNDKTAEALKALQTVLATLVSNTLDEERVVELVKEHAPKGEDRVLPSPTVKVVTEDKTVELTEKPRHKAFAPLLGMIQRVNVLMVGPAGGGKTTLGEHLAEALSELTGDDWKFFHSTRVTHESQLLGYNDAGGNFVETEFYRAYTRPHSIFMLDEVDGSVPDAQVALNSAVENGKCPFAKGTVNKADNVIIMASANTYGFGANAQYVGRYPLDGAFKNRWTMFRLDYDEALERMIARIEAEKFGFNKGEADHWVDRVQKLRAAKDKVGALHIISPRASIYGARLLDHSFDELEDMLVWQGLDEATQQKIKAAA